MNRRRFLELSLSVGATLASTPTLASTFDGYEEDSTFSPIPNWALYGNHKSEIERGYFLIQQEVLKTIIQ